MPVARDIAFNSLSAVADLRANLSSEMSIFLSYTKVAPCQDGASPSRPLSSHFPTNGSLKYKWHMHPVPTLANNLKALMVYACDQGHPRLASVKGLAAASGISRAGIDNVLHSRKAATLDTIEALAGAYGLQAWQLLVPGLDPANPPVVTVTEEEKELYKRIRAVADQLAQHPGGGIESEQPGIGQITGSGSNRTRKRAGEAR